LKTLHQYLTSILRPQTVKIYLFEINKYLLLNKNAATYDYQKVMQYVASLRAKHPINTIKRILASIIKYYEYCIEIKIRKDNPARAIKMRDGKETPIQLQDLFSEKELQILLIPKIERYPFLTQRNQIIMSLMVNQAITSGEITSLKIEDINLEKAFIQITGTGITNNRVLPLKAEQIFLLHQYIINYRNQLRTSKSKTNILLLGKTGNPLTASGIGYLVALYQNQFTKKLTTITIRQSVITNLLAKNNDLRMVQHFAGHKTPDTTEKYRQTGINALRNAIEQLHPIK
jgi:integrase/recombinase XerD